jgi:hypothetical protein
MNALICAWMRVDLADQDAFLEFHTREHLPERLAIPGFLRGRRFQSLAMPDTLLVLYEVESLAVLTSASYVERLNNPTDWTKRAMPLIRDNRRLAVVLDIDTGDAGEFVVATHIANPDEAFAKAIVSCAAPLAARDGVKAVRIGHADAGASNIPTTERKALGAHPHAHGMLFTLETNSEDIARTAIADTPLASEPFEAFRLQTACYPPS